MDSLTHVVVGAVVGEALGGKSLGKRAMLYGALLHSLPDIDVVASGWLTVPENLLAHRGFTHSFLFAALAAALFGALLHRWHRGPAPGFMRWILFSFALIVLHPLLDVQNSYGTGWWEPFDHARLSLNTMFVLDPFFTIWTLVGSVVLLILRAHHRVRPRVALFALGFTLTYVIYTAGNRAGIEAAVQSQLVHQHITSQRLFITPAPLSAWLWYVVVETKDGYCTGYRSVFDAGDRTLDLHFFPRNDSLLESFREEASIQRLIRFSQGYYVITSEEDRLVFNDLRFGQIMGWERLDAPFVFHYYLNAPDKNQLVIQRGRITGWGEGAFTSLVSRIKGR